MRREDVDWFADWFAEHVDRFLRDCPDADRAPIHRKDQHTRFVVGTICQIGIGLGLNKDDMMIAETVAWFHDIGRFTQWKMYGTFSDSKSEDHALLGLKILHDYDVLERLSEAEREMVKGAIEHHGKRRLPPPLPGRVELFAKMLRDADKLDIWRQLVAFQPGENAANDNVVTYGLPASPSYSKRIMADLLKGRSSDFNYAENQTDATLLRLGWVFDLNFEVSRRLTLEKGYIETISLGLPNTTEVEKLKTKLLDHMREKKL
jgi:hypothetical protein